LERVRVSRGAWGNQHYRAIDSLSLTLGTDSATIKKFEKRNVSDYEHVGSISENDVEEMRAIAEKLREDFESWIAGLRQITRILNRSLLGADARGHLQ